MNLAFFDIDGTVYSSEIGVVRPAVAQAIANAQAHGTLCCVASGRSFGFLPQAIKDLNFDAYLCCNGAVLYVQNQLWIHDTMQEEDVLNIVKELEQAHIEYDLQKWDHSIVKKDYHKLRSYFKSSGISEAVLWEQVDAYDDCVKIEMWMDSQKDFDTALRFAKPFSYEVHRETSHLEFFSPKHTKASAAQVLMDHFKPDKTISFGDSLNDLPLAKVVDCSVAMGNAIDALKAQADIIAPSIEEDGVAVVLNQWIEGCL